MEKVEVSWHESANTTEGVRKQQTQLGTGKLWDADPKHVFQFTGLR